MKSRFVISVLLCTMLFACATRGPTRKELKNTPIPSFLENHSGVLVPTPTAEGIPFPNYLEIFSLSDEDIKNMQRGGASKFMRSGEGTLLRAGLYILTNPIGSAAAITAGTVAGLTAGALSDGSSGDPEKEVIQKYDGDLRDLTEEENDAILAIVGALGKSGYVRDVSQAIAEFCINNGIQVHEGTTIRDLRESLCSFYTYRKLGGKKKYQKYRFRYYGDIISWEKDINTPSLEDGRLISSAELEQVYFNCFQRIESGEKVSFREAILEYRIESNIPSLKHTPEEFKECLSTYRSQEPEKREEFIEFENKFREKMKKKQVDK